MTKISMNDYLVVTYSGNAEKPISINRVKALSELDALKTWLPTMEKASSVEEIYEQLNVGPNAIYVEKLC